MLGVLPDVTRHATAAWSEAGQTLLLLGNLEPADGLGGSEYLATLHGATAGRAPALDLALELRLQDALRRLIAAGLVRHAHDCSEGGLLVAIAEGCIAAKQGAQINLPHPADAAQLFGEAPSRVIIAVGDDALATVQQRLGESNVPHAALGVVGGARLIVEGGCDLALADLAAAWENALPAAMGVQG